MNQNENNKLFSPNLLAAAMFVILGTVFTVQMVNKPLSDWGNYYYGSNFLLNGTFGKDVYEPFKFNMMVRQQGETDIFLNYTPIPPFTALFYVPFQFTGVINAKIIFSILSVLIFALVFYRFTKFLQINSYWLLIIPILLVFPMRSNIFFGQTYLLIIAMLMEGYISYRTDKKILAGVLWSVAILLKLFPGIILLYLLFKKDYKQLGITAAFILVLSLITAAVTGFTLNYDYFTHIMPRMLNNDINDTYASSYQSMPVLLNKIFVYDKLLNPTGSMEQPVLFKILYALYSFTVLYICAMFTLKNENEGNDILKFSLWLVAGLLVTGYGSGYSLLLLIFITITSVQQFKNKFKLAIIFGFIFAICSIPVHMFTKYSVLMQFPRLYIFILFFIILIIFFKITPQLKYYIAVPVLAVAFGFLRAGSVSNSEYVLNKEEALLIYDYTESNGKLKIKFIDQNGRNEKELEYPVQLSESPQIEIKNNKLYYNGNELLTSGGNIVNAKLNGSGEVYYLSDNNRGVGFFTLRKAYISK